VKIRPRTKPRPGRLKGDELASLRISAYERDGHRCVRCGRTVFPDMDQEQNGSMHLSHKRGKRMWGDSLDQVETYCGYCHRTFHNYGPSMEKPCPPKYRNL